ncbi:RCC1 and BTB domain-containing protein 1-like isoform X1 [Lasioglossum baleicum]|uniref:RCC1 and BTB domain-containing protein 1-like isoform X1 n=1 Tax=Lasioglossum baleicum TaxID=434251 RepID=UPI003FCC81FD
MTPKLKNWPIFSFLEPKFISNIYMVLVYGDLGNSCLIVTKDQMIYALGYNCDHCNCYKIDWSNGQSIICPRRIEPLCGQKIKTMAYAKGSYMLVLTENGKVYSWGSWRCTSRSNCSCHYTIPKGIELNVEDNFAVDIACGNYHSMALTNAGNVYVWGDTESGQVTWMQSSGPSRVNTGGLDVPFRSISCGANHCMAVACNGHVYSWGSNSEGQLGLGDIKIRTTACEVTYLSGIVIEKVVCGCNHTLALSDKGTLYSWGDNTFGQLGVILDNKKNSSTPIALPRLLKVLDMGASNCANISVAMGMDHQIFIWGKCLEQSITIPTLIPVDSIHDAFALYASPRAMHQPFVVGDEEKKEEGDVEIMNIMDHIGAAFDDKSTSDLTIEVQGKPIYVHKPILKSSSKYFNVMFQGDWKENKTSVLSICEFSYVAYRAFLKFLYTNEIDARMPTENVLELLQLADFCDEDNLKASYTGVLMHRISTDNTALFYSLGVQCNIPVLKSRCIRFAVKHMAEISKSTSFSELTKETMRDFIIEVVDEGTFKS